MFSNLADEAYAARVVKLLLASYPGMTPTDGEIYVRQLVAACMNRPKGVLKDMVNPVSGLLSTSKYLPTIAEVNEFLAVRIRFSGWEKQIEQAKKREAQIAQEAVDPAEREKEVAKLLALSNEIRKAAKAREMPKWDDISVLSPEENARIEEAILNG